MLTCSQHPTLRTIIVNCCQAWPQVRVQREHYNPSARQYRSSITFESWRQARDLALVFVQVLPDFPVYGWHRAQLWRVPTPSWWWVSPSGLIKYTHFRSLHLEVHTQSIWVWASMLISSPKGLYPGDVGDTRILTGKTEKRGLWSWGKALSNRNGPPNASLVPECCLLPCCKRLFPCKTLKKYQHPQIFEFPQSSKEVNIFQILFKCSSMFISLKFRI